jgi:hypothetical protein
MTDEASYLLIALDPWKTWGHGTFHGFLLRPLYLLGGSSVVGLRWIGYAIVLVAAWRLAGAIRARLGRQKGILSELVTPVLLTSSMSVYAAGMRTPCYNWMILVGAMMAWSGWLRCGAGRLGAAEMGIGLTVAWSGKWGAALALLAMFGAFSLLPLTRSLGPSPRNWRRTLIFLSATSGIVMAYAGLAGIRDTVQAGILIAQTTGSHGWFILPKYGWELAYYVYRVGRAYLWLLPAILFFWWLARWKSGRWPVTKIATILFVAGLSLAAVRGWWRGGIEQFGKESVLAGCWLLGVAWTVWAVKRRGEAGGRMPEDREQRAEDGSQWPVVGGRSLVLWGLVATPFLCGIGTNTSIADYAGQGTVFFSAAGILMFAMAPFAEVRGVAVVALTGLCLIQAARVTSSLLGMYRLGSVLEQTEMITEGPEARRLWVDPDTSSELLSIHRILQAKSFRPGTPVVGVDSLCGWIYLTGGISPGVPWFFRDQPEYLKEVLAKLDPRTLRKSWVWIRSSSRIANPVAWWPQVEIPFPRQAAVQAHLQTDRGSETLSLFVPTL